MSEIRISSNAIAYDSSILLYESSKETTNLDPKFYKIITGSGNKSRFGTFGGGTFSGFPQDPGTGGGGGGTGGGGGVSTVAPNLSDITVTKNEVVYDSAGKPTVTVSFKIKNSSGVAINGVNTRVSML
jgi:hypothetical protein